MNTPLKIYCIRHNVTNRVYIGSSQRVEQRLKNHFEALRGHRHIVEDMQDDFDKYGDNYTVTILEEVVDYNEKNKEYQWMEKYQSHVRGKGYNYKDHVFTSRKKAKIMLTFDGKTMTLRGWADKTGLSYETLYSRVVVGKWDAEKALTTPIKHCETYFKRMERLRNERDNRHRT